MTFKQDDNKRKGRIYLEDDSTAETEITYVYAGPLKIIIDHTGVSEIYKGRNIGRKLVNSVVDFARANEIIIIPLCPFAKVMMTKDDSYKDVLA